MRAKIILFTLFLALSTSAWAEEPWPGAEQLLAESIAQSGSPEAQQTLLKDAMPDPGDDLKFRSVGAALVVAQNLAGNGVTDPEVHRELLTAALMGTPEDRKEAIRKSASAGTQPAAIPGPPGEPGVPRRPYADISALSPDRLHALRKYRAQHLAIRGETEIHGGGMSAYGPMWYGSYPYWWQSPALVVSEPIYTTRTWGVYRGPQRLTVPEFLDVAGETARKDALEKDISRAQTASYVWFGGAGVGIAAIITGMVGMGTATDSDTYAVFNAISLGGTGLTVAGLLGASFPGSKANRLRRLPGASLSLEESQDMVHAYNESLRSNLGITPDEVWLMEMGEQGP